MPVSGLGFFGTLLVSLAAGFMAFFAGTFCAIVGILIYNRATHRAVDLALSYRDVGLPVGVLMLVVALVYMGRLWVRGQIRRT